MDSDISTPGDSANIKQPGVAQQLYRKIGEVHQRWLDKSTPHPTLRWASWFGLCLLYSLRVYFLQGWYIVSYAVGIYLLNLFIAFLTPKIDPSLDQHDEDGPTLPTKSTEEFRPFMRRLPEFKFWYSAIKAVLIATFCTFFDVFNVPVFWPILVMYFVLLFTITMKRQIKHMIRYRYLPFSYGKTKYRGKEESENTASLEIFPVSATENAASAYALPLKDAGKEMAAKPPVHEH